MKITQRTATLDDAGTLLTWRNHPETRKFSRNPDEICSNEHLEWLTARLERVQLEPFYIFIEDSKAIGMTRLETTSGSIHHYEISVLVDPNNQGKGLGRRILSLTCESFFHQYPKSTIVAHIKWNNYVSQKLFLGAGFELLPSLGNFLSFKKSLN